MSGKRCEALVGKATALGALKTQFQIPRTLPTRPPKYSGPAKLLRAQLINSLYQISIDQKRALIIQRVEKYLYSIGALYIPVENADEVLKRPEINSNLIPKLKFLVQANESILGCLGLHEIDYSVIYGNRIRAEADYVLYTSRVIDIMKADGLKTRKNIRSK